MSDVVIQSESSPGPNFETFDPEEIKKKINFSLRTLASHNFDDKGFPIQELKDLATLFLNYSDHLPLYGPHYHQQYHNVIILPLLDFFLYKMTLLPDHCVPTEMIPVIGYFKKLWEALKTPYGDNMMNLPKILPILRDLHKLAIRVLGPSLPHPVLWGVDREITWQETRFPMQEYKFQPGAILPSSMSTAVEAAKQSIRDAFPVLQTKPGTSHKHIIVAAECCLTFLSAYDNDPSTKFSPSYANGIHNDIMLQLFRFLVTGMANNSHPQQFADKVSRHTVALMRSLNPVKPGPGGGVQPDLSVIVPMMRVLYNDIIELCQLAGHPGVSHLPDLQKIDSRLTKIEGLLRLAGRI